ncbi:Disease resistance protein RPV1 [Linum perenne]
MAASSSSSASSVSPLPPSSPPPSHSSLYTGEWEYDVFLCFRGDDTRLGFTSHLMNALSDKQIRTFIDNMLEKTESIDELISILQRSALSVVIFSEKFADSVWCLDEVATIARRMVKFGHRVLPIFYNVDPSDVADDCRSYATTIDREYKGRITYSEDKKKWMNALKNVANCAGHTSQAIKIESELIKAIVEDVQKQLIDMSPCIKSADLVGMGSRILELFSLRAFRQHRPPHDWVDLSRQATSYCKGNPLALTVLGGTLFGQDQQVKDLIDKSLLTCASLENEEKIEVHDLLKEMAWNIVNEEPNPGKRSRIVDPDDVRNLLSTVELKKNWSIPRFNLLIARKKRKFNNPLKEHRTTEGIHLDLHAAKEMFLKADAFEGMNCLTFLKFEWKPQYGNHATSKLKFHLPYGGLNSLPEGLRWLQWDGYPAKSLPSKFHAQHLVHLIIRQSPIRRCWKGYDQPQLVNLIVLDLSYCKNLIAIPNISRSSNLEELLLCACESLVEVPSNFQYLTKLITLDLTKCRNLKRLPPKLDSKLLKHVRMSHCPKVTHCPEISSRELEVFNLEETPLVELPNAIYNVKQDGVLYLYGKYITKFPAITASLKTFALCHTSIREIDLHDYHYHQASSELVLPRFHQLYLDGNSQLKSLPKSIWNMVSYSLVIYESPLIEILPEVSEPVNSFTSLYIGYCGGLKSLPSNLGNIKSLTFLSLSNVGVTSLPSSIQELKQLTIIELSCCKSLMSIPSSIHKLSKLLNLRLKDCKSIRSLPELPPNLESLDVSSCKSLQALPSNTGKLLHLESLKFDDCPQFNQTSLAEIVANFLPHASLVLDHKYTLVCSRIELPEWFTYKSVNLKKAERCIVKVALPLLKDSGQSIIKGIAFGAVVSPQPDYYPMRMTCECKVGNTTVASWNPQTRDQVVTCESFSEMLWLAFDNNLLGCNQWLSLREGKEDEAWHL